LRPASPTYGKFVQQTLHENQALFIPDGFAHGFFALENTLVTYKCTTEYDPKTEYGILFDSVPGLDWPLVKEMSEKDRLLPTFTKWKEYYECVIS